MSKLTNRFIVLFAALALPACGSATTSSAPTDATGTVDPVATAAPTTDGLATTDELPTPDLLPTTEASSSAVVELSTRVDSTTPVDPDEDETPAPGEVPAGVVLIEELGEPGDPAAPTPDDPFVRVPFAVVPVPVPINPVPPFAPFELVADLEAHTPAAGGGSFTAATGCGSLCISDARISTIGGSSTTYDLIVVLDIADPVEVEAFLSQAPIERNADGRSIPPFSEPTASGKASADWAPGVSHWETSFALEPATTYHLLVQAQDAQGQSAVAGTFTTADAMGPDTLASPSPCLDGCLQDIRVGASDDGRSLSISVDSKVDADVDFQWEQGPLVQGDDGPTLNDPSERSAVLEAGTPTTLELFGLTPTRSYSFVVIATDSFGSSDRWAGTVSTRSPVIIAGIDRAHISGDGDPGSSNRGEISFSFGDEVSHWGYRDREKLSSNSTVGLGRDSASAIEVDPFGRYPWIAVVASEKDGTQRGTCFVSANPTGGWMPETITECRGARFMHSMARVPSMTLTEIEQLPTCETFDINHTGADRCTLIETMPNSDQQVSFEAIIWFDLDPLG